MEMLIPGGLLKCKAITSATAEGLADKVTEFLSEQVNGGLINFKTFYSVQESSRYTAILLYLPELISVDEIEEEDDEEYYYVDEEK